MEKAELIVRANDALPLAHQALQDAKTLSNGLEVCVNLANDFTKMVEPMQKLNNAMAEAGLGEKLQLFITNVDMATAKEAWSAYTIGEQSLGFLLRVSGGVGVGFATRNASKEVCSSIFNMSEKRAKLLANVVGIATCAAFLIRGDGLVQAATYGACAFGVQYAAKVIGTGIRAFRAFTGW